MVQSLPRPNVLAPPTQIPETCSYFDNKLKHIDSRLLFSCVFFFSCHAKCLQNKKTRFLCDNQRCQLHLAKCHMTGPTSIVKGSDPDSLTNRAGGKRKTRHSQDVSIISLFLVEQYFFSLSLETHIHFLAPFHTFGVGIAA